MKSKDSWTWWCLFGPSQRLFPLSKLVTFGKQPNSFQLGGRQYVGGPEGGPDWGMRFAVTFLFPK